MTITPEELGRILFEEFDGWGTVGTASFKTLPRRKGNPEFDPERDSSPDAGVYEVVQRVASRLNARDQDPFGGGY